MKGFFLIFPRIFCFLPLGIPINSFLLKSKGVPLPCFPLDGALGLSPSSSSLPQDDDQNTSSLSSPGNKGDPKETELIKLKWNIPNLFSVRSDMPGSSHKHLRDVYMAAQQAQARRLQSIRPTSITSSSENGPSWNANPSADTAATILLPNPKLDKVRRFLIDHPMYYDLGHDGRFGTGNNFVSLQANLVFSMDRPLTYMHEVLSFSGGGQHASPSTNPQYQTQRSSGDDVEEVVVFCPGLHTPLSQSTRQRQYLSQVMNGMKILHLHVGTYTCTSQDPEEVDEKIQVYLTADTVLALRALDVAVECGRDCAPECESSIDGGWYGLTLHELDILRALVAWQWQPNNDAARQEEDQLVDTLVKLVDVAVENVSRADADADANAQTFTSTANRKEPHLVLLAYSATARAVAAAVAQWKHQATTTLPTNHNTGLNSLRNTGLSMTEAQVLLRQAVTVVTIAGLCQIDSYPDGPAYIHVSMYDDPLAAQFQDKTEGADQDAVVLRAFSPYLYDTNSDNDSGQAIISLADHAHNPEASTIQFLSLVMRKNGIQGQGFRQLYNEGHKTTPQVDMDSSYFGISYYINKVGELDLPQSDDLLAAMIRATGGNRWLLTPSHLPDEDDNILPDSNNAESTIMEHFGYGVYDEIVDACGG